MTRRFFKIAVLVAVACLVLNGLERLARAQTTGGGAPTGGGGGGGGGGSGGGTSLFGPQGSSSLTGSNTGTNGASFSGGSAGFSGTTASPAGAGGRTGSASGVGIPAASNVFSGFYGNPMGFGLAGATGTTTKAAFGQPLYALVTAARTTGATRTGTVRKTTRATVSFNTYGRDRDTPYSTRLDEEMVLPTREASVVESALKERLAGTFAVKNRDGVNISMDGATVVLRGQVASQKERNLLETMFYLEPGVYQIRNELTLAPPLPKQ